MAPWAFPWLMRLMILKLLTTSGEEACHAGGGRSATETGQEMLLELAKQTLLSKLNLKELPTIQPSVPSSMLATALRLQGKQLAMAGPHPQEELEPIRDEDQGRQYEIIMFPEEDYADSYGVCLYFRFSADEERSVEFLNATLWLFVLNSRKRRRLVTITSSLCRRDNVDCTFVAQMQLDVWRSRWFNVTLEPPNLSQDGKRLRIELRCEGCHGASRLASTSGFDRPFMVVEARHGATHVPHRRSLTCTSSSDTCCRNSFYVSFKEIGWNNWIIWPEGYYMNYCKGECPLNLAGIPGLAASFHTAVYNLIKAHNVPSSVGSCCVATKLQPLSILYFDNSTNIVKKDIQNMIVERCGCT